MTASGSVYCSTAAKTGANVGIGRADLLAAAPVEVLGRAHVVGQVLDVHADQEQQRHGGDGRGPPALPGPQQQLDGGDDGDGREVQQPRQDLEVVAPDHAEVGADGRRAEDGEDGQRDVEPGPADAADDHPDGGQHQDQQADPGVAVDPELVGQHAAEVASSGRAMYDGLSPLSGISIDGSSSWKKMIEPKNAAYGVPTVFHGDRRAVAADDGRAAPPTTWAAAITATRITASRRMLYAAAPITPSTTSWPVGADQQRVAGRDPVQPPDEHGDHRRVRVLRQQLVGVEQQDRRGADDGDDAEGDDPPGPAPHDPVDQHEPHAERRRPRAASAGRSRSPTGARTATAAAASPTGRRSG